MRALNMEVSYTCSTQEAAATWLGFASKRIIWRRSITLSRFLAPMTPAQHR